MPSLNAATIILVMFCFGSQVYFNLAVTSRAYSFPNLQLIVGRNHVRDTKLVYALCKYSRNERSAKCEIIYKNDVFHSAERPSRCNLDLRVELSSEKIEILTIDLMGENKAVFIWRAVDYANFDQARVTVQILTMPACSLTERKWTVDNREDMISQLFVLPSYDSYIVAFMDNLACDNYFCKVILYEDGSIGDAESWFPNTGMVYALEPIDNDSNYLLITVGDTLENYGRVTYSLLGATEQELGRSDSSERFGWSTTNGVYSFCNDVNCKQIDAADRTSSTIRLRMRNRPIEYAALYNLPNKGILAFVCDNRPNSPYRIIKIGLDGEEEFSVNFDEIKCSQKPDYMNSVFSQNRNGQYCLSVYHSDHQSLSTGKFSIHCL